MYRHHTRPVGRSLPELRRMVAMWTLIVLMMLTAASLAIAHWRADNNDTAQQAAQAAGEPTEAQPSHYVGSYLRYRDQ